MAPGSPALLAFRREGLACFVVGLILEAGAQVGRTGAPSSNLSSGFGCRGAPRAPQTRGGGRRSPGCRLWPLTRGRRGAPAPGREGGLLRGWPAELLLLRAPEASGSFPARAALLGGAVALQDLSNTQYSGLIEIGSPAQVVRVLMDTGSSDLWVHSGSFQPRASLTATESGGDVSISYGQGSVTGGIFTDNINIGGIEITSQNFLVPSSERGMANVAADGVLGLALPGLSHTGKTLLQRLRHQAGISAFCLYLTGTLEGSYLSLGPPEPSWYADHFVLWTPAVTDMWWAFEGALSVGGREQLSGTFLLDSGTSYLAVAPSALAGLLAELLPQHALARCQVQEGMRVYVCPCDVSTEVRSLEVRIGGAAFPLRPEELLVPNDGGDCVLQLMPTIDGMPFILGDTFLRTVFAIFDTEGRRIGLSARADNEPPQPYTEHARELPLPLGLLWLLCAGWLLSEAGLCVLDAMGCAAGHLRRRGPGASAREVAAGGVAPAAGYLRLPAYGA